MMASTPYQVLPPLSDDEFAALKADIAERGILVPIELDEDGAVLDGHHRLRAWESWRAEGLTPADYPKVVRAGLGRTGEARTRAAAQRRSAAPLPRATSGPRRPGPHRCAAATEPPDRGRSWRRSQDGRRRTETAWKALGKFPNATARQRTAGLPRGGGHARSRPPRSTRSRSIWRWRASRT